MDLFRFLLKKAPSVITLALALACSAAADVTPTEFVSTIEGYGNTYLVPAFALPDGHPPIDRYQRPSASTTDKQPLFVTDISDVVLRGEATVPNQPIWAKGPTTGSLVAVGEHDEADSIPLLRAIGICPPTDECLPTADKLERLHAVAQDLIKALRVAGICPLSGQCVPSADKLMRLGAIAKETEQWEPVPSRVLPGTPSSTPPSDAVILFDGRNLDQWVGTNDREPARWPVHDGILTVDKTLGNIETKRHFRNYQLHMEWRIPQDITGEGQARGNSGLFLASTGPDDAGYEIQILDSWNNSTYVNGQAASIYKQTPPLVNAMRAPGEWQSYDVIWLAPSFAPDGALKRPAYVTLFHNGVLVQDHTRLAGETVFIGKPVYRPYERAAVKLQAHRDPSAPISFRNIWLREIGDEE